MIIRNQIKRDEEKLAKVLDKKLLFTGKIFNVERWKIQTELFQPIVREVVTHNPVVVIVAINQHNQALITKEYRVGVNKEVYGIPAGFMEQGESPEIAAARELREETGFVADDVTSLATVNSSEGFTNERAHLVLARFNETNLGTDFDKDELVHTQKVNFETLLNMVYDNEICADNSVSAILLANHYLNN